MQGTKLVILTTMVFVLVTKRCTRTVASDIFVTNIELYPKYATNFQHVRTRRFLHFARLPAQLWLMIAKHKTKLSTVGRP